MWIRKLQRLRDSVVLTIPRDVMRRWERDRISYVEVEWTGEALLVRPLPTEQLVHHARSEEEG